MHIKYLTHHILNVTISPGLELGYNDPSFKGNISVNPHAYLLWRDEFSLHSLTVRTILLPSSYGEVRHLTETRNAGKVQKKVISFLQYGISECQASCLFVAER